MRISLNLIALILIVIVCQGCSGKVRNVAEYNEWLNNPSNGCILQRKVNGGCISVKYQPDPYLYMLNRERAGGGMQDSSSAIEGDAVYFLMTIGPDIIIRCLKTGR